MSMKDEFNEKTIFCLDRRLADSSFCSFCNKTEWTNNDELNAAKIFVLGTKKGTEVVALQLLMRTRWCKNGQRDVRDMSVLGTILADYLLYNFCIRAGRWGIASSRQETSVSR